MAPNVPASLCKSNRRHFPDRQSSRLLGGRGRLFLGCLLLESPHAVSRQSLSRPAIYLYAQNMCHIMIRWSPFAIIVLFPIGCSSPLSTCANPSTKKFVTSTVTFTLLLWRHRGFYSLWECTIGSKIETHPSRFDVLSRFDKSRLFL